MYLAIFLLLNQPGIIIHATGGFQRDVHFLAEPQSITTVEGMTVFIPCSFEGTDAAPSWNIKFKNGTIFTASSSDLPPKHLYNGSGIILQDVDVNLNHTTYVCYVIFADTFEKGRIDFNTLRSTPGTVHVFGRHDDIISLQRIVILSKFNQSGHMKCTCNVFASSSDALHRLVLSSNLVLIPCQRGVKHQAIILNTSESPNFNESELPSINLQVDCTDKQGHETSHFFRLDSWPPTHIMNVHEVFGIVVAIMFVCVHMNLTSRAKILFQDVKEWNKGEYSFLSYQIIILWQS